MKKWIKTQQRRFIAWWNCEETLSAKDKEIVELRNSLQELIVINAGQASQLEKFTQDIILMARNVEKERKDYSNALEIQRVKYVLLERRANSSKTLI